MENENVKYLHKKLEFFDAEADDNKTHELKTKIYSLIDGYTLRQVKKAFRIVENDLEEGFVISLKD